MWKDVPSHVPSPQNGVHKAYGNTTNNNNNNNNLLHENGNYENNNDGASDDNDGSGEDSGGDGIGTRAGANPPAGAGGNYMGMTNVLQVFFLYHLINHDR